MNQTTEQSSEVDGEKDGSNTSAPSHSAGSAPKLSPCKIGSAWHSWQSAGRQWREANEVNDAAMTAMAAMRFAILQGWPNASHSARYRAFLEGAAAE